MPRLFTCLYIWLTCLALIAVFLALGPMVGVALAQPPQPQEVVAAVPRHFPPYYFVDEEGQPQGFAIDVMEQLAQRADLGVTYLVKDTWGDTLDALRSGEADLIPNLGINPQRQEDFSFGHSFEVYPISLFVRDSTRNIASLADCRGYAVATVETNVAVSLLQEEEGINLVVYDSPEEAFFALITGEVDVFAYPKPVVLKMAQDAGLETRIEIVGEPLAEIERSVAVRKGDTRCWPT